ncbi:MAG: hypothetical protein A2Z19_05085 [Deltaproteobacteria bacterium RBG_16_54_18]|nr:MAG: hypothetical protein A2Z19_05085 [Deltaproteobacteria bacterium RBG_16_54_18]
MPKIITILNKLTIGRYVFAFILLVFPTICLAAVPTLIGTIDLNAPITQLRVTPDGKRAVVMLQPSGNQSWGMRVIDTSNPQKPILKGFLDVLGKLALSPDGRQALILKEIEKEKYDTPTRHEIIAIDLSNPDSPKVQWRREILARKVVLADDASAYAASMPSKIEPKPGEGKIWQTVISWTRNDRPESVVEEAKHTYGDMHLSDRATFLLLPQHKRQFRLFDLRAKEPILYEQGFTSFYRYGSLLGFLESGHIIVEDTRAPRIGVYAPQKGIPRIATLTHDIGNYCTRLNLNETGTALILDNTSLNIISPRGRVDRIDVQLPEKISFSGSWQLPPATYPKAATQTYLFATGGDHGREMKIFHLDVSTLSTPSIVDWNSLEAAHRDTMDRYNRDIREKKPIPYHYAINRLEEAGVQQALDATVEGISNKKAAVILNDYGFLTFKENANSKLAETALRRAIVLDPERAITRLNLADMLRARLSFLTDFSAKQKQLSEIKALYQKYLALGGKSNARIESILKDETDRIASGNICRAIASYANAGRLEELVSGIGINIKVGERRLDFVFSTEGTAHVPVMYVFDAKTDFPLKDDEISIPDANELGGGDELGLVVYRDAAHILHYRDFRHPVATTPLTGGDACEFEAKTVEKIGPKAIEPNLCRSLIKGEGPPSIVFKTPAPIERENVSKRYSETGGANNMCLLDFANDGKPVNVAEMEISFRGGVGCDAKFYDILDNTGQNLLSGTKHELLMKLQDADPSKRYPPICSNEPRFFVYRDKVYFENKPADWTIDNGGEYHRVTRIDQGKVVDVCDFKFETTIVPVN